MKHPLTASLLALALGAAPIKASAQTARLGLAGSDSWEPIIDNAFLLDPSLSTGSDGHNADLSKFLSYTGGGQTPGETALKNSASTHQVVAVFTAQLTDTGTNCTATYPNAQDAVIGVDGIVVVGEQTHFPSGHPTLNTNRAVTAAPPVTSAAVSEVLGSWQNVLSVLFLGYDSNNAAAGNNCNSDIRRALAADYGNLFASSSSGGATVNVPSSNLAANTPIKHVFRRGDASATSKLFLQLLGVPSANRVYCNGTDSQDLDPVRRQADATDQIAEFDGTLGLLLSIVVPTFSNTAADLYVGGDGNSPATFGKFLGGQAPNCGVTAPSPIDISTAAPGAAATNYAGLSTAGTSASARCDCRFPVPSDFTNPSSPEAKRFGWNVKLGIGCQGPQSAATSSGWNVLNGDDGTRENTPAGWGTRVNTAVGSLPTGVARCCRVGTPATFEREDPRLVNLFVRNIANGNLQGVTAASTTAPVFAFYRLAATDQGLTNIDLPFNKRCAQTIASDVQVACLVNSVPGKIDSLGFGALPIYKDLTSPSVNLPPTVPFNLDSNLNPDSSPKNDPSLNNYASIRSRSYGLSRYVFLSSTLGFANLGESSVAHTGSLTSYNYFGSINDPVNNPSATPVVAPGTYTQQVDAQWNLAKALFNDSRKTDGTAAVERLGFLALGFDPYAVACADDANDPNLAANKKIALSTATYFAK